MEKIFPLPAKKEIESTPRHTLKLVACWIKDKQGQKENSIGFQTKDENGTGSGRESESESESEREIKRERGERERRRERGREAINSRCY